MKKNNYKFQSMEVALHYYENYLLNKAGIMVIDPSARLTEEEIEFLFFCYGGPGFEREKNKIEKFIKNYKH